MIKLVVNQRESNDYNMLLNVVRETNDPSDPWGTNIAWLFALADYVWLEYEHAMPGYTPAPMGVDPTTGTLELQYLCRTGPFIPYETLSRVYRILSRRDSILRSLGRSY